MFIAYVFLALRPKHAEAERRAGASTTPYLRERVRRAARAVGGGSGAVRRLASAQSGTWHVRPPPGTRGPRGDAAFHSDETENIYNKIRCTN